MKKTKHISLILLILTIALALLGTAGLAGGGYGSEVPYDSVSAIDKSADEGDLRIALPSYFASGMVIQRDENINVWGYCKDDGVNITVTLGDREAQTTVSDGEWHVTLEPLCAAKNLSLVISAPAINEEITISEVDIGDVFVMSGQSNIDYPLHKMEGAEEYVSQAKNYENIRFFDQPSKYSLYEEKIGEGKWYNANSKNLSDKNVSAIGYVMATRISDGLADNTTIAIVDCSYAGTMIQPWIDEYTYNLSIRDDAHNYYSSATLDAFRKYYDENGRFPVTAESLKDYFTNSTAYAALSQSEVEKPIRVVTSVCYNALVAHLKGISVKAVVWYQGEGNLLGDDYSKYFGVLAESYRKAFSDSDLPFFMIQLSPYYNKNYQSAVCGTKASQFDASVKDDNVYVISSSLEGFLACNQDLIYGMNEESLIHPARKSPIGLRLGASVLNALYGMTLPVSPSPISITRDGGTVYVKFDSDLSLLWGTEVIGFALSNDGSSFYDATAVIDGDTVILTSEQVENPMVVRYGFGQLKFELKDGRRITVSRVVSVDKLSAVIVDSLMMQHELKRGDIIRSYVDGNVTNDSGYPVPTFKLFVGYTNDMGGEE